MTHEHYAVAWAPSAQRDLSRLPQKIATAAVEFAYGSLASNPRGLGHELHLELEGHYAARRGDYRLIYRIDDEARAIRIVTVDHRADTYRSRQRST